MNLKNGVFSKMAYINTNSVFIVTINSYHHMNKMKIAVGVINKAAAANFFFFAVDLARVAIKNYFQVLILTGLTGFNLNFFICFLRVFWLRECTFHFEGHLKASVKAFLA